MSTSISTQKSPSAPNASAALSRPHPDDPTVAERAAPSGSTTRRRAGNLDGATRHTVEAAPRHRVVEHLRAFAHDLPLRDRSVDAAMSLLSLHHWDEQQAQGVRELRRVAKGPVVLLTCDPIVSAAWWLMADYLPEVAELDRRIFPSLARLASWLGGTTRTEVVPVPRDTCDSMLLSFWAHPERVLDASYRSVTSGFARMKPHVVERVVGSLQRDLGNGNWDARHGQLRELDEYDAGLRLLINTPT